MDSSTESVTALQYLHLLCSPEDILGSGIYLKSQASSKIRAWRKSRCAFHVMPRSVRIDPRQFSGPPTRSRWSRGLGTGIGIVLDLECILVSLAVAIHLMHLGDRCLGIILGLHVIPINNMAPHNAPREISSPRATNPMQALANG